MLPHLVGAAAGTRTASTVQGAGSALASNGEALTSRQALADDHAEAVLDAGERHVLRYRRQASHRDAASLGSDAAMGLPRSL